MARDGHVARVVIPAGPGSAENFYRDVGIAVDRLPIRKPVSHRNPGGFGLYLLHLPLAVTRIIAYLRRQRPDLIHVNGAFDLAPGLAGWLAGLPLVWHLNDTAPPRGVARILGKIVALMATRVVVAAAAVAAHYGIDPRRAEVVFAPVETDRYAARDPEDRPKTPAVIGFLGNWNPLKGPDRFIEVIRRLLEHGYAVRGCMMGGLLEKQARYWQPLLDRIEKTDLDGAIDRLGFVADPAEIMREVDVMLLTSRSEACPMCVLEAMSVGVPQVCFRVGGVPELLGTDAEADEAAGKPGTGPAGLTVSEGDVEAMVTAVERLLSERDQYRRLAQAGQARARALFSLDVCVARHHAVYDAAIRERRRSA